MVNRHDFFHLRGVLVWSNCCSGKRDDRFAAGTALELGFCIDVLHADAQGSAQEHLVKGESWSNRRGSDHFTDGRLTELPANFCGMTMLYTLLPVFTPVLRCFVARDC
jgi:hypothetical protein